MFKGNIIDPSKFKSEEFRILRSQLKDLNNGKILRTEDTDDDGVQIATLMKSLLSQYPEEILGEDFKGGNNYE